MYHNGLQSVSLLQNMTSVATKLVVDPTCELSLKVEKSHRKDVVATNLFIRRKYFSPTEKRSFFRRAKQENALIIYRGRSSMHERSFEYFLSAVESRLNELPFLNVSHTVLEGKSLHEQAELFATATVILCGHGAALVNTVFCLRCRLVIEVFHPPSWSQISRIGWYNAFRESFPGLHWLQISTYAPNETAKLIYYYFHAVLPPVSCDRYPGILNPYETGFWKDFFKGKDACAMLSL